jgi:hypothetical protein
MSKSHQFGGFYAKAKKAPRPEGAPRRASKLEDKTLQELKKILDEEISFFLRGSAALYSPIPGAVRCFTCGGLFPWKKMDAGHYIPRHRDGTRYDGDNLRPQCTHCNSYHEGEHWLFRHNLVEELGVKRVEALEAKALLWGEREHPREFFYNQIPMMREKNKLLRKAMREKGLLASSKKEAIK